MSIFRNLLKSKQEKVDEKNKENQQVDNSFFLCKKAKDLPPTFAQDLMSLEMQLECSEEKDLETIAKLSNIYRIAIEHFIEQDKSKACHFQKKLTTMLTNPLILSAIDRVPVKPETTKGEHYSEELKQRLNQFSAQSDSVVKKLLLKNEEKAKKTRFMIEQNINVQEKKLTDRVNKRSKSKSKKKLPKETSNDDE